MATRFVLAFALTILASASAWAQDLHLVYWKKTHQCEVVSTLPLFGNHWEELGVYDSRFQADRALRAARRTHQCPLPQPSLADPSTPRSDGAR
jgi:hypothetical protein